jgi:hypothetical protein
MPFSTITRLCTVLRRQLVSFLSSPRVSHKSMILSRQKPASVSKLLAPCCSLLFTSIMCTIYPVSSCMGLLKSTPVGRRDMGILWPVIGRIYGARGTGLMMPISRSSTGVEPWYKVCIASCSGSLEASRYWTVPFLLRKLSIALKTGHFNLILSFSFRVDYVPYVLEPYYLFHYIAAYDY